LKKYVYFLLVVVFIFILTGCSGSKQKLYIFNWSYYIPDEVIENFEKDFNVDVVYDVFSSNEEMFAKLKSGGTGYDIVFPSGDYASIMINLGMVEPIDLNNIPNYKYLDKSVLQKITFDTQSNYSIPYMMGGTGIAVNTKYVKNYEKGWNIFFDENLKNKMTLLDDMREVFGIALKQLGYSVNTKNTDELNEAKDLIMKWKKNILKFDAESFAKGFAAEEFYVVHGYAENIFLELEDKSNVDFFIPEIGGPMYVDTMMILKGSKNKELAEKFINYIHDPKVYAQIVDYLGLPSINTEARNLRTTAPYYTIDDLKNSEFKEDLGDFLSFYNKLWQEIRVEN